MTSPRLEPPPAALPPGSTVWAYLRDSGGPTQDRSIDQQRNELLEYCQKHGLVLARIFEDVHKSGGSIKERDEFLRMMTLAAHEKPQGLLIWNFARFSRGGPYDAQLYKATLRSYGVTIHSLTDKIPEGEFGAVIETIIDIANKQKREEAAFGAARGLRDLVRQGAVSGVPPVGIMRVPLKVVSSQGVERTAHRWQPDPAYRLRIRRAFEMRAEGKSLAQIHTETKLYKTKETYTRLFSNPIYIGRLKFGELVIENYCEAVVPRKVWDKVQVIVEKNLSRRHLQSATAHPRQAKGTFALSGIVRCARCGSTHISHSSPQRYGEPYRTYKCGSAVRHSGCDVNPIPAKLLEKLVIENLLAFFDDENNLIQMQASIQQENDHHAAQVDEKLASLAPQLVTVRRKIANTAAALADMGASKALSKQLAQFEADETDLQGRIQRLKTEQPEPVHIPTRAQAKAACQQIKTDLQSKDPESRRQILLGTLHTVTVDRIANRVLVHIVMYKKKAYDVTVPTFGVPVGAPSHTHSIFAEGTVLPAGRPLPIKKTVI